ncbi:ABC transporter ATP-binding protein [Paracoccus sp. M683]|uniref:ATP-binding cassette domain-containing protein n=1 Tax=Paracoccus sp. M683 TaxID=2594268 RepID=UPI00117C81E7|nr:ABC transporter ATP-binding protein [Paracoccus sp. M683]TRW97748.1 ABC transporter ATP-binding protein [Paracoccus sp. M683]
MIRITDLHLHRDGQPILHGIDANIPATGLTAVIGPNGAGKSSLLHCLAGLTAPDQGAVQVGNADIAKARPADRARMVALLTQSTPALPRLTVAELVAFGRWPHHRGRPTRADREIVAQSMDAFDLAGLAGRRVDTLSGGQRQRAFVAMAHAQSTPWMLLDEPLAALDPKYARDIMDRLHGLSRPGPDARGIIVVLHDLAMAARYADWVISLKDGRLVGNAPRSDVMTSEGLSALFESDIIVEDLRGRPVVVLA